MPSYVCFAIVAAFRVAPAAAVPLVELAPIAPPVAELAGRLGLEPANDRARFMAEIARRLYAGTDARPLTLAASRAPAAVTAGPAPVFVPVPLPASVWSRAVFRRTVPPDQLIEMILSDRRAALLCRGLAGVDDKTLGFLVEHPPLITFLYERGAAAFAAFGDSLRVHEGRVVPPGGERAAPLWEAVVRAPLSAPDAFVRLLFGEHEGRLAYLYGVVAAAEPQAADFALGLWMPAAQRVSRFQALADACTRSYREWQLEARPFARPLGDLGMLLFRLRLAPSGGPAEPAGRQFWASIFDVDPNLASPIEGTPSGGPVGSIDAGWLVAATGAADMYARVERLDQLSFGQRVFGASTVAEHTQAAAVVRAFWRYRMLLLTIERMGVQSLQVMAAAVRGAESAAAATAERRFWVLAQFQGAAAVVARMRRAGSLDAASAGDLIRSLSAVPLEDGEYGGGVARWVQTELGHALRGDGGWEERVMMALAGRAEPPAAPTIVWEGQRYRLDLALAERQRLEVVRGKQGGHTLDLALAIEGIGRRLRSQHLGLDDVRAATLAVRAIAAESAERLGRPPVNLMPPGVEAPRDGLDWLNAVGDSLTRITRSDEVRRAPRLGLSLQQLADIVLGDALLSLAYAADIGDPDGAALLAGNVALRHDFGLARRDAEGRARAPWAQPRQDFQPGVPWHVAGSILGLDLALAPLNLRRLSIDRLADAPTLSSIERDALALTVGLMEPRRLRDADRDALAAAVDRGRARLNALRGQDALDEVADRLGLDGWRRRALAWQMEHEPQSMAAQFSLVEAFTLGGGAAGADLDAWGTPALHSDGCACLRFPGARAWRVLEGHLQLPVMAATMGDLNLAVALMLRELQLPASMARTVLAMAMLDFIDDVRASNGTDVQSISRQAQKLERRRVEDYVSAAAAVGGPLVPEDEEPGSPRQH